MDRVIEQLRELLPADGAALIGSVPNRFYVTGFETSDGYVYISHKQAVFLIDFRYVEKAREVVHSCRVQLSTAPMKELAELCAADGVGTLFVENEYVSMSALKTLHEALPGLEIPEDTRLDDTLRDLRSVKNEHELSLIRQAQKLTDDTFTYILGQIAPGRTEREIMLDMEFYMRRLGSEGVSFDFIVVSGKNSSLPHGVPTDKKVERGDFLTMDFGARIDGYCSDMTRTVVVGRADAEMKKLYNTVLRAQTAAIDFVREGVLCCDADKVARDIIDAEYKGCFGHSLGHGVGMYIHEEPRLSSRCTKVLKVGHVVTVEPGIYIPGKYGVRIEDMMQITSSGAIDITKSPKNLIEI